MTDLNFNLRRFKTIFNQLHVAQSRGEIELDAIYGLKTSTDTETFTDTGGSVDVFETSTDGRLFRCQTGTSVGGYGLIRSQRSVRYRPGQEVSLGFTAAFSTPATLGAQRAGGVTSGSELSFGYNGDAFGVLRRRGGKLEHYRFDITAAATGNETVTFTLDGTDFDVSVTSGTAKHNAFEVAGNTFSGWTVWHNNVSIFFLATAVGNKTGSFSVSSTGTFAADTTKVADGQAVEGTKPAEIRVILNPTLGGEPDWQYQNETGSIVEYDTAATTVTVGSSSQIILTDALGKSGSGTENVLGLNIRMVPFDVITVAGRATSSTSDITASLTWEEQ